jgi:predicted dehydrogenase
MARLAVIGLGGRAVGMCKAMKAVDPTIEITAVVDPSPDKVVRSLKEMGFNPERTALLTSAQELVERRNEFDGIMIGTRCNLHTPMAVAVAQAQRPVFLEKPVGLTYDQLVELSNAYRGREHQVLVSFPLRLTTLFEDVLTIIKSGRLGVINQIQAINNVYYGYCYYHEWYRDFKQNGGLWLQKATHDLDYVNLLAQSQPVSVAAMISRQVYDHPVAPQEIAQIRTDKDPIPDCPVTHQDAGSAIVMYDNGLHAVYSQNFVTRESAGRRGAIITGHAGTLEFDWVTNNIRVVDHLRKRVDNIHIDPKGSDDGHGGGDGKLASNFIQMMKGQADALSNLNDGILSASMCLAARESANTHTFQPVNLPGQPAPRTGPRAVERL